jgi:3-hydroxyisobutyrate dehydrogenase-like beta-hydroxyacid dehydrogenase
MVERLVASGHDVRVLGRSPQARESLLAAGATPVADAAAVGAGAAAVCVCVFNDDQVRAVCLDSGMLDAMPAGAVVILHTTGSPATAAAIAAAAEPRDVGVIDCPVSGGPHDIAAGRLTLFAGGKAEHTERARPILAAYGDPVLHVGPLGAGQGVKLVNNAVFAANIGLLAAAVQVGSSFGVAEDLLLTALTHGSAASRALSAAAGRGSVTAFGEAVREFLGKDVAVVRAIAAEQGAELGALDTAIRLLPGQEQDSQEQGRRPGAAVSHVVPASGPDGGGRQAGRPRS